MIKKINKSSIRKRVAKSMLPYAVIGFMLARLELFGIVNPIIMGYLSVFCYRSGFYAVAAAAALGLLSIHTDIYISRYILAIVIMCVMHMLGCERYKQGYSAGLAVLSAGLMFAMYMDFSLYYAMAAVIEAVLALSLNVILKDNIGALNIIDMPVSDTESYPAEIERIAAGRLRSISSVFKRISVSYSDAVVGEYADEAGEKQRILDTITQCTCSRCPMLEECWHKNCADTYRVFYNAIDGWIKSGEVSPMPKRFREVCGLSGEISARADGCIELYAAEKAWREKLGSVRQLVAKQMRSAGAAVESLCKDLECSNVDRSLSNKLYKGLTSELVKSVAAVKNDGAFEIYITLENCHNCNVCTDVIIPKIREITGRDFVRRDMSCATDSHSCFLHLIEEPPLRLSIASASAARQDSDVSGDCYTYINIKGKCILAVADGMGSGSAAREESAASIELYEDFVSAGFDCESTLDIINSVLLMRENRESFSTLDICTVDLYSGSTEFVKIGAVSTFIIHGDGVEVIRASTLPVGILGHVDTDVQHRKLEKGDIIVMVTDGILDSTGNVLRNEDWIVRLIEERTNNNPKVLADAILSRAEQNSMGIIRDDMTVLVSTLY